MKFYGVVLLVMVCAGLSSCGIKPKHVQPPNQGQDDTFQREYPAPELNHK